MPRLGGRCVDSRRLGARTRAALRLFVTQGYAGTTLADIAREAGVAVPTATLVYGTMRNVLVAACDRAVKGGDERGHVASRGPVHDLREQSGISIPPQAVAGAVSRAFVALGTDAVEEKQPLEVPVSREEGTLERHPVGGRPSDEPIAARSEVLRVPVREDQVAVDEQAVVLR
jgi:AcrR family transcriptional regulator